MREAASSPASRARRRHRARRAGGPTAEESVMAIVHNGAKRKLRQGDIALGFGLHHLRSSATPMLAGAAQHDYVSMDMEHGAFTVQEATQICIACLAAGIPAVVRVCSGALDEATRLL